MTEYTYIATTANNKKVYVDLAGSHAATHIIDTPDLLALVRECLAAMVVEGKNVYADKDMGRIIGKTDLVKTTADDRIVYAKRLNRDNYTRFAMGRQAEPTSYITVVLHAGKDGSYELYSAWIGQAVPQFPGDEHETPESVPFWRTHALVWGNQAIQPGTETGEWPWD